MRAAASSVDIKSIGRSASELEIRSETRQHKRRGLESCAVRRIDGDLQRFQRARFWKRGGCERRVLLDCIAQVVNSADIFCGRVARIVARIEICALDGLLQLIAEFVAIRSEKFNTVIFKRVV